MFDILDPTTTSDEDPIAYAPRPTGLGGLKIGLVENTKPNSEAVQHAVAARMAAEHGAETAFLRAPRFRLVENRRAQRDAQDRPG